MALVLRLSGGSSNANTDNSLGGVMSSVAVVDAVLQNLLDNIKRKEVLIPKTEFRCFYIENTGADPVHGAILFVDQDPNVTTVTLGLDPAGTSDGSTYGVAQTIADESTAPTGVTFEDAGEHRVKLALPTLQSGEAQAIWIKRISETATGQTLTVGLTTTGNEEVIIPDDLTINDNTVANPTHVTTTIDHNLVTGNQVTISGSNSTPSINGEHTITRIDANTFSVPVNVTVGGTTGTVAIGGNILYADGISIGERMGFTTLSSPFLIGTAKIGQAEIS